MKHILHTSALLGLTILLAGAVVASCKKDPLDEFNPKTETIAEAGFSLKGTETRSDGEYVLPWTISKGGVMDSELEDLDELAITPFNTFTFEAVPDNASGFPGINAKTDNACVKLERKGQSSFSISYVTDGDATIKVWNGNEGGNTAVTFKVQARKTIPVEGLLVRLDDKEEVVIKAVTGGTWDELYDAMMENPFCTVRYVEWKKGMNLPDHYTMWDVFAKYSREELHLRKLEILHLQPENTTVRRLNYSKLTPGYSCIVSYLFCEGEFEWFDQLNRSTRDINIPNGKDASMLYGKSIFFCSSPGGKPGNVIKTYCPSGQYYLMEKEGPENSSFTSTKGIYQLANSVKVVQ